MSLTGLLRRRRAFPYARSTVQTYQISTRLEEGRESKGFQYV